jgi:hypothetical protein
VELSHRTDLVECTLHTVETNLVEGGLFVVAGLRLLGNIRGGLIVAVAISLSMLFAVTRMVAADLSGNLMSVGAVDFGFIVDGSVVADRSPILLAERKDHLDWTLFEPSDASFLCPRTAARPEFCTDAGRLYMHGFINPVNPVTQVPPINEAIP